MQINIIHSGSDGNCTVVTDNYGNQIMLDCGIGEERIYPHIDFAHLDAILVSHSHKDHSLSEKIFAKFRIDIYNQNNVVDGNTIELPNWVIVPMKLIHNVICYGYLICSRKEKKKLAYITDTNYIPKLGAVDCLICDCNYDMDIVYKLNEMGKPPQMGYKNHLSIQAVKSYLSELQCKPSCFVAFHLSNSGLVNIEKLQEELSPLVNRLEISKPNTIIEV